MKTKDEMIEALLETLDDMSETIEEHVRVEADFANIQPFVEQLREEIVSLSDVE